MLPERGDRNEPLGTSRLKFYFEAREQILWTGFANWIKIEYHTVL
jgi:hypothetical protein